ncbi:hypothetical protein, partial [Oceanospirillum linum]|uniref:hypothetical protein n=1 Tax=Oceanospirillum linum TaxID=966 RepID=UPI001EE43B4F
LEIPFRIFWHQRRREKASRTLAQFKRDGLITRDSPRIALREIQQAKRQTGPTPEHADPLIRVNESRESSSLPRRIQQPEHGRLKLPGPTPRGCWQ